MKRIAFGASALFFACTAASAQPAGSAVPVDAAPAAAAESMIVVPAGAVVDLELTQPVGSKISKTGDTFTFKLRGPLQINGAEVLPNGTIGGGEVVHAARARAAGKAGELILAARYLEHGGKRIKLRSFKLGQQAGNSSADTAILVSLVAAPLALFVVGGEIDVPAGAVAHAKIAADVALERLPAGNP